MKNTDHLDHLDRGDDVTPEMTAMLTELEGNIPLPNTDPDEPVVVILGGED